MKKKGRKILIIILISIFMVEIGISVFVLLSKENNKSLTSEKNSSKKNITNISEKSEISDKNINEVNNTQKEESKNIDVTDNKQNTKETTNTKSNKNNNINDKANNNASNENKVITNKKDSKSTISATKEYYCSYGYTLNDNKCEYSISDEALVKYVCDSGVVDGSKCIVNTTIQIRYTSVAEEICANYYGSGYWSRCVCNKSGGTLQSDGKCYQNTTIKKDASIEYYCPSGFELNGNKCNKHYETDALFKYTCPEGYTLNNTKCEK